jgi:hypothetical protein
MGTARSSLHTHFPFSAVHWVNLILPVLSLQHALHPILLAHILLHLRKATTIRSQSTVGLGMHLYSGHYVSTLDRACTTGAKFVLKACRFGSSGALFTIEYRATTRRVYMNDLTSVAVFNNNNNNNNNNTESEIWFGESAEGVFPETVTWFRD